jgi:uncharacterized protein (DUF488 family)
MRTISTIGYEGSQLADFIDTLHRAGVEQVIDIREVAASRRPGFSKTALMNALAGDNIEYTHLRSLGDPKAGRDAARAGRYELFKSIFAEHMESETAKSALQIAIQLAAERPSTLLCYERDARTCHRNIVAYKMSELADFTVRHLGVQKRRDRANHAGSIGDTALSI